MKKELKEIVKEIRSSQMAKAYLVEIKETRTKYNRKLNKIEKDVNEKLKKIEKLNKQSFYSIYKKLLGTHEEVLEMTKQHYLNMMLEYNELAKSIDTIDFEIEVLSKKLKKFETIKKDLKETLRKRSKNVKSTKLKAYQKVIKTIDAKLGLMKEIEEAIEEGVHLNKKFNSAINFIKRKADNLYDERKDIKATINFDISKLNRYQDYMVIIQHHMAKFEKEMNDVYNQILNSNEQKYKVGENFMAEYRMNLVADIQQNKYLSNSLVFLKNHKSIMMSLTRSLRSDLRKIKKELPKLEKKEAEFFKKI